MAEPTRPGEVPGHDPETLLDSWELRVRLLSGSHGPERAPIALSALAYGTKLTQVVGAQLWPIVVDALDAGGSHEQVSAAMNLSPGVLSALLGDWADEQLAAGAIDAARHSEVLTMAGFPLPEGDPR